MRLSSNLVIGVSVSLMQGTMPEAVDNLKHGVSADGCHTLRICGIVAGWLKNASVIPQRRIEKTIHVIRKKQVMLDRDFAELYGVKAIAYASRCGGTMTVFQRTSCFSCQNRKLQAWYHKM